MKKSFLTLYTTPSLLIFLVFSYLLLGCFSHSSQYNITTKIPPPISKKNLTGTARRRKKWRRKVSALFDFFFLSPFLVGYMSGKLLLRFSFPFCCCCWLVEICRLRYFGSYPASLGGRLSRSINVTRIFVGLLLFVASAALQPDRNWSINYPKTTRISTKQNITQNVSANAHRSTILYNSRRHTNTYI